jgi:hypothetical protein
MITIYITRPMVASVINQFQDSFDTHMVEKRILRLHAPAFARQLLEFQRTGDPLHQFSTHFGKWVDRQFRGQITKTARPSTENLAGVRTENQQWQRIDRNTPVS